MSVFLVLQLLQNSAFPHSYRVLRPTDENCILETFERTMIFI